jgi:predicted ATP-dependent endonuclease of OLD family
MRIEKLYYRNHVTGWQLDPMEFGDVNLLVGVSGVGKTKILEVIRSLKEIAFGSPWYHHSANGIEWDITFSTSLESQYKWCGKFSEINNSNYLIDRPNESTYLRTVQNEPQIEVEELYENGECIASRKNGEIEFDNRIMPKLSPSESLIKIFWSEDKINPIINNWRLIIDSQSQYSGKWLGSSPRQIVDGLSINDIKNTKVNLTDRLGLISVNYPEMLAKIQSNLIEVFPHVEDIRIQKTYVRLLSNDEEPSIIFSLELKEVNVNQWITQSDISMGMLKTLAHIVEIYLLAEGSILLIDEFENSLGVNCIDVVSELLKERKDIQFIITSHHPYIINKIPMQYWKIITRKGSVVKATNASDYEELSGSRHKVFTQLINLPDYTEGIQVG